MAALCPGVKYGLSSQQNFGEDKDLIFVKLTDSALRAIEEYIKSQVSLDFQQLSYQKWKFDSSHGSTTESPYSSVLLTYYDQIFNCTSSKLCFAQALSAQIGGHFEETILNNSNFRGLKLSPRQHIDQF